MRIVAAAQQATGSNWQQLVFTVVLIGLVFYVFRRMSRSAQAKQEEARNSLLVVGTNVVTTSGFLGTIVDIDGDAITLESPSGEESVWLKAAISQQMDIPLASVSEDVSDDASADLDDVTAKEDLTDGTSAFETQESNSDTGTDKSAQA